MYDFYFRVYHRLTRDIKVPFKMDGGTGTDDITVHQALREALANCLINADYYGREGLVIIKKRDAITISNPGGFRIEIDTAKSGGISDPRNGAMQKMFNLIDIGACAGSGISNIYRVWREHGWVTPTITETFEPNRTTLTLAFKKAGDKETVIDGSKKKTVMSGKVKETIIAFLTDYPEAKASAIAEHIGLKSSRTQDYLNELISEDIVAAEGSNQNRTYRLKS